MSNDIENRFLFIMLNILTILDILSCTAFVFNIEIMTLLGKTSMEKKCFLLGIARMRGGGTLPEFKNKLWIFVFGGAKKTEKLPDGGGGGGGEVRRAMPKRKQFFSS